MLELTGDSGVVVLVSWHILAAIGAPLGQDIEPLVAGTFYDIYCYSEYYRPPAPPGSIQPPRQGMTNQEILETRYMIHSKGPQFDELGWAPPKVSQIINKSLYTRFLMLFDPKECVSGRNCSIDNILGGPLSYLDRVMVREDECPGRCKCLGRVDPNRKGGSCSAISQDPLVVSGFDHRVGQKGATKPRRLFSVLFSSTDSTAFLFWSRLKLL